jgi:hypothetical protein
MTGDFTASKLYNVQAALNEMWTGSALSRDLVNPIDSMMAIAENQKIRSQKLLTENGECRSLEVSWIKSDCEDPEMECLTEADSCEITGNEFESVKKEYKIEQCVRDTFFVWDDDCPNIIKASEQIAHGMMTVEKRIEAKLNKAAISFLDAHTDDNTLVVGNSMNVAGVGTFFNPAEWNHELIAQLALIMHVNKITDPVFLTGTNLWTNHFNAKYENLNDNERDRIAKLTHFPNWYFDALTVDSLLAMKATFGFNPGSFAFLSKYDYKTKAPENKLDALNTHTWMQPMRRLQYRVNNSLTPVVMDCAWQRKCKVTPQGRKIWGTAYEFKVSYEFVTGPTSCDDKLGCFKFINGTP